MKASQSNKKVPSYPHPEAKELKTSCRGPVDQVFQSYQELELNAKPIKGVKKFIVNPSDNRGHVEKTADWPNSVYGMVAFDIENALYWGTGTLIGPNLVLTAGHNLYSHQENAYANLETMQFLPAVNGQRLPFSYVEVEKFFVSPNYIKEKKEDYGLLVLKEPIGEKTGYFGLACLEEEELMEKRIYLKGYPGDKVASKPNTYELWEGDGEVSGVRSDLGVFEYLIPTAPGQSGGGVFYQEGDDYYICGIHVSSGLIVKRATFLTKAIYKQIYKWLKGLKCNESFFMLEAKEDEPKESEKLEKLDLFNCKIEAQYEISPFSDERGEKV